MSTQDTTEIFSLDDRLALASGQDDRVDMIAAYLQELAKTPEGAVETPLVHTFTPGLYSRTMKVPAGTIVVTRIHKTRHQFGVFAGKVSVWTKEDGISRIQAPYLGITEPGTQRLVYVHEDCLWTTFHPTHETDLTTLENELAVTPNLPELSMEQLVAIDVQFSKIMKHLAIEPSEAQTQ